MSFVASSAYADVVTIGNTDYHSVKFDTSTTEDGGLNYDWEVANITPPRNDGGNYTGNEAQNLQWSQNYLSGADYDTAFAPTGAGRGRDWISGTQWISTDTESRIPNGFYAYKISLWSDATADAANGILRLTGYYSDDYTVAIYFNDLSLDISGASKSSGGQWTQLQDFEFSDLTVKSGLNDIIFVVNNTNGGGSGNPNASGISLSAELLSSVEFTNPGAPSSTPEPATMLIFGLGIAGLGIARRMKK